MKVNNYVDIATIDKDAKKDYIDRHSPFLACADTAKDNMQAIMVVSKINLADNDVFIVILL